MDLTILCEEITQKSLILVENLISSPKEAKFREKVAEKRRESFITFPARNKHVYREKNAENCPFSSVETSAIVAKKRPIFLLKQARSTRLKTVNFSWMCRVKKSLIFCSLN